MRSLDFTSDVPKVLPILQLPIFRIILLYFSYKQSMSYKLFKVSNSKSTYAL